MRATVFMGMLIARACVREGDDPLIRKTVATEADSQLIPPRPTARSF
ncbi:MAG: hypothetical protein MUE46_03400 [Xanthomonadales bacterium]|jgi:hypothetical protein|nr:hypothetical protein [Xanthomonadales bacterium]